MPWAFQDDMVMEVPYWCHGHALLIMCHEFALVKSRMYIQWTLSWTPKIFIIPRAKISCLVHVLLQCLIHFLPRTCPDLVLVIKCLDHVLLVTWFLKPKNLKLAKSFHEPIFFKERGTVREKIFQATSRFDFIKTNFAPCYDHVCYCSNPCFKNYFASRSNLWQNERFPHASREIQLIFGWYLGKNKSPYMNFKWITKCI
jgi:hypothetical protein